MKKFSKEQNEFKMKQCQQNAAKEPLDQYELNLYVLDLNYNSIDTDPMVLWQRIVDIVSF